MGKGNSKWKKGTSKQLNISGEKRDAISIKQEKTSKKIIKWNI